MTGASVELCARTFRFPHECPCCGFEPDAELAIRFRSDGRALASDSAKHIAFPYCRRCVEHVASWEAGSLTLGVLTLIGLFGGALVLASDGLLRGALVFAIPIITGLFVSSLSQSRARTLCSRACASADRAVTFHGWTGTTTMFAFESPSYTARFAEQNAATLVSVDAKLRKLLEDYKVARLQVPTPAAAVRSVPSPRDVPAWLAHIKQQPSRVLKRMALTRALDVVGDERDRELLVHTVCRDELVPLFASLDGASDGTKYRALRDAIAATRADNLPPELRTAQLAELERRLRPQEPQR